VELFEVLARCGRDDGARLEELGMRDGGVAPVLVEPGKEQGLFVNAREVVRLTSAGITQVRLAKALRNVGFSATVSARALKSRLPIDASFDQLGTSPQR
jgi:hypothetical protein